MKIEEERQTGMSEQKTILVYARPWNVTQMEHLAKGVWGSDAILAVASEHKKVDKCGLASRFAELFEKTNDQSTTRLLSPAEAADVILRCRLLRNIPPKQANRLLVAMETTLDEILTTVQPSAMLSLTIDSYVMDVFAILCHQRRIPFIGLVPSFVKEHFRITTRGEYVRSRDVTNDQIEQALESLTVEDYRPDFLVQSSKEMNKQMWRLWVRNLPKPLWFALLRMKQGEKLNYHYWASQIVSKKFWSIWPKRLEGISGPDLSDLANDAGPGLIYIPLQMSPEATIDYWSADTDWIDYEQVILKLVRKYQNKWRFLIKEHPNLLGYRSRGFYAALRAEPNCIMVSPKVPSNDLVSISDGVMVCTGTAGFETILRGKPTLSDSEPYYAPADEVLPISALDGDLPAPKVSSNDQRRHVEYLLRGILPGRFLNNGTWNADNPEHRNWSDTMASSIRGYLEFVETQSNTVTGAQV